MSTQKVPLAFGLALLGLSASAALAQAPTGRASGVVTDPDDQPLVGAEVRIWPSGEPQGGPPAIRTDDEGRWSAAALEPGRWQLEIEADGFYPAEGWFQVLGARPSPPVDVSLRSLAETSPSFAENRSTVIRWIERGNALLEQGQTAEARTEYERALGALPREERPEVLQAVARTHFIEGDSDLAVERLQDAIAIDPQNEALRALFLTLLKTAGRLDEAEALLAQATEAGREATAEPPTTVQIPTRRQIELPPLVEATPGRTGSFRTRLAESSPLAGMETYLARYGYTREQVAEVDPDAGAYDLAEESFQVFVPASYSGDEPHGILVYVSPTPLGGFRNPEFERVLAERRLIWVGANNSGNGRLGWYRVALALDAVHNLKRLYRIDDRRIYVSGYSGGGRITSTLAILYPEVFRGGFTLYGSSYYTRIRVPDRPGSYWPPAFPAPDQRALERVKADSRFVLLTGDRDFNRSQTKSIHRRMESDGFRHVTYLQIPEADHYFGLPPEWLEKGLDALDAPLPSADSENASS